MIIKYDEDAFVDVDSITAIVGTYPPENESRWCTKFVIGNQSCTVYGKSGKCVMDAYKWKNRTTVNDMRPDSKTYYLKDIKDVDKILEGV